ncbi:MAG: tryptophan--tRNA ligase [Candidatus Pacebacteria bacterium RIFCSPLOWO2_01_FULL_47_12]|nr:MAG: tryptophan--tRNA ligase [Candidatus Pacebacteria bacterium RIFCSPHIGHO2_02_FULL_46_9]OGJ39428.1 MAG: tryptophan--tRNA ligase [Candidatus Pacebacteria bacterium RIFCSPLOWO2_01_FULL_47_12]
MQQTVFSGIRATGRLHLGNYLGAVKGMLALQDDPKLACFFMVADVHTITTPYDIDELRVNRREVIIDYLAAGLDPERSTLFLQSMVGEHLELAFLFSSVMSIARMQHLPTFKDKVRQYPDHATMALLNYPLLMTADILLYKAHLVPVGVDQEPHIEIARQVARKMNEVYGTSFPEPTRFATKGEYVPSLQGAGKMSKSVAGSYISLTDSEAEVLARLSAAPTDSGKGSLASMPQGVVNLLQLVELFAGSKQRAMYESQYETTGIRYGELKKELASKIFAELKPLQEKRHELESNPTFIDQVIAAGAAKAQVVARKTLSEVREKMGLG